MDKKEREEAKEKLRDLLLELEAYNKYEELTLGELKERLPEEYHCCVCCEECAFEVDEKVILVTSPSGFEEPATYVLCSDCYLEIMQYDLRNVDVDPVICPTKKICAFCETEFEEDLIWTDGYVYFCKECALKMNKAIEKIKKNRLPVH